MFIRHSLAALLFDLIVALLVTGVLPIASNLASDRIVGIFTLLGVSILLPGLQSYA